MPVCFAFETSRISWLPPSPIVVCRLADGSGGSGKIVAHIPYTVLSRTSRYEARCSEVSRPETAERGGARRAYGVAAAPRPTVLSISSKVTPLVSNPMNQKAMAPRTHQDAK